jgi:hypothetical protein
VQHWGARDPIRADLGWDQLIDRFQDIDKI